MFKINLIHIALATALTSTVTWADPGSYTLATGPKVIDIEKPNDAGVSHNIYRSFDVDQKGVILNNSIDNIQHSTYGNIARNNNLNGAAASMIINEVVSTQASTLQGFIEVAGQKADVIVANPNGITCSGCSFINTKRAVLTTGSVNLNESGAVDNYKITNGNITIDGKGLTANNDFTVLLADAININGMINTNQMSIAAGNFTLDDKSGSIVSSGKAATAREFRDNKLSIDISQLGGVRANSITMVGTNLGFGVRNKGAIVANNRLLMTSNGRLTNDGTMESHGVNGVGAQFTSASTLENNGTIAATSMMLINSSDKLVNKGTITNSSRLIMQAAGDIENHGNIKGAAALVMGTGGSLTTQSGSSMKSDGLLSINSLNNMNLKGDILGNDVTLNFGGSQFNAVGSVKANSSLNILSYNNTDNTTPGNGNINVSGELLAASNLQVKTNGKFSNQASGEIWAASYSINSNAFENRGDLRGDNAQISANKFDNYNIMYSDRLNINTTGNVYNEGTMQGSAEMMIDTTLNGKIINRGLIHTEGTLTLTTNRVENGGYRCGLFGWRTCSVGTLSANKLVLNSKHDYSSQMGGTQRFKLAEINTF
ncbi:filamentous hemagglutinin N-terminal domain-containing protein [Silvania hatchlandensis]|uniref:Filamentous hemagglutinin N-terminal domain-containing protein n=1 Tax=Silvania hatchlandensis TaxID=2926469 RepID=A0A9J6Q736_9ENTR|nr:filamentous hemagglutinin N-terminal domain-containing protein [Silvania hatchlandensis]MCU6666019.1 filamentous hemagglutinin N-terminal domain-containing protein [Silvania hatchlandensis]